MTEIINGEVVRVTYENEQTHFRVLRVAVEGRGTLTAVGRFPFVAAGTCVRLTGETVHDAKHGEQFRVQTLVAMDPKTLAGIEKYLGSGVLAGIGPALAKRIVEKFGNSTLDVLDRNPERLIEVRGLGRGRVQEIRGRWKEQRQMGSLAMLLQGYGIGMHLARRISDRYGDRAAEIVETSPYRLAIEVKGIGFKTADSIALSKGISRSHPERVQAGVYHELRTRSEQGHVYCPHAELCERTARALDVDEALVQSAVDALWASERVVVEEERVYLAELHRAEAGLAEMFSFLASRELKAVAGTVEAMLAFEQRAGIELAPAQRQAIQTAAKVPLCIITGGPGVGKTTIIRGVVGVFGIAKQRVRLAAPTGRAAKRLAEATGQTAMTLHRLLEFEPKLRCFQRGADRPLDADVVVVDEFSMVDLHLALALLQALGPNTRLVVVGDADQLPSVGPGCVLRDVIECGQLPVVRLEQVFRQAEHSGIVKNAHGILNGRAPVTTAEANALGDFFVIERTRPEQAAATVLELVTQRIPRRFSLDPMRDVQVLCPMHRGAAGTVHLNERLQQALNPQGPALCRGASTFRAGDRVMQLRNDYEREVFNGDQGMVRSVDAAQASIDVAFDERVVRYSETELDNLVLAYATTIHKSQGSEYPAIVIPFLTSHFVMLSKNLLYTAVTRARRLCVLVADPRAIQLALEVVQRDVRYSQLAQRLRDAAR